VSESPAHITFGLTNRDLALVLLGDADFEAQLIAIRAALHRNAADEKQTGEEIKQFAEHVKNYSGDEEYQVNLENHWVDLMHGSVFQDAAHSMSAVGMLAPLVESLLVALFAGIKEHQQGDGPPAQDPRSMAVEKDFWDPHYVFEPARRTDLVAGAHQLAASTGLAAHLPQGWDAVITALMAYRNKMFHHGFEWPQSERDKFEKRIANDGWQPEWFLKSTSAGKPWIFYMSSIFIDQCIVTIEGILEGAGAYLRQKRVDNS
jgi:hypothetical protein